MTLEKADIGSDMSNACGILCLGPLTFHQSAVGDKVHLSQGYRHAKRDKNTFKNGLVFSSRPVRAQERIRLRIEAEAPKWNGAMRVGFTNVSPDSRSLPLPDFAIPNLTNTSGHWAARVSEALCKTGSELIFWVSRSGSIYVADQYGCKKKLLKGVILKKPLWAMIDIYGKTCSILLLGSKKRGFLSTRRSCETSPMLYADTDSVISPLLNPTKDGEERTTCVACMNRQANVFLPCGHRCLCQKCLVRVIENFDTCPLCRCSITGQSTGWRLILDH
nr:E3 ubiquitin-protein ligase NEURL3-like [Nerophis lumbriciformis]